MEIMNIKYHINDNKCILVELTDDNQLKSVSLWKYSSMAYEWVELKETHKYYKQVKNNLNKVINKEDFNSLQFER